MLLDILEEHADDASFLAERWMAGEASSSSHDENEQRLRAHLDGLMLGGAVAWSIAKSKAIRAGDAFVAAWMALEGDSSWREELDWVRLPASGDTQPTSMAAQRFARGCRAETVPGARSSHSSSSSP